jgi:hypothetical protein
MAALVRASGFVSRDLIRAIISDRVSGARFRRGRIFGTGAIMLGIQETLSRSDASNFPASAGWMRPARQWKSLRQARHRASPFRRPTGNNNKTQYPKAQARREPTCAARLFAPD